MEATQDYSYKVMTDDGLQETGVEVFLCENKICVSKEGKIKYYNSLKEADLD